MKVNIAKYDRICGNRLFPLTFVVLAFLFILLFSYSTSPLFAIETGDSSVFKMMGHVLLNGGVPYVDYFDHKGPYLYLINAIGESISPTWGLFPLQVLCMSLSLWLWYKTARLFVRPTYAFGIVLLTMVSFLGVYENGNLSEEWSLLPCSLCVYLSLSYLVNCPSERHRYWRSLLYGLCFGFVFLIRPNDAVMICGGVMTGIFLYIVIRQKQYVSALVNALTFFLGAAVMAAPWIAYFATHNALSAFYFGLIGFNIDYNEGVLYNLMFIYRNKKLLFICLISIGLIITAKKQNLLWIAIPITLFTILLFGRKNYPHYYIIITPSIILLYASMLFCQRNKMLIAIFAILPFIIFPYMNDGVREIKRTAKQIVTGGIGQHLNGLKIDVSEAKHLLSFVPEEERDSIWNYGDYFSSYFHHCGITAQNSVPPVIAQYRQPFPEEMQKQQDLISKKPLWIFKENKKYLFPEDSAFICEHYSLAKESEYSSFQLLKRKKTNKISEK